ncbi:hypothetical protein BURPS1710b_A0731 [Burkholderia pseudomallei 1710b]|uniref:Uncharacterized protein n=1 Tax=Burkholderia pseudomallei (strain 1710b) TaxID=320372 RepID=Q3JKL4_BURP1|nr:hypothetical protein BURPS1710b_A0731 [Burkholderia pseudomallei 1710b]
MAETRLISSDCNAISFPLRLFHFHQERFEFRCLRVAVADGRSQGVREIAGLRQSLEAPVQRHADRLHLPAVDHERLDALGDERDRDDVPAVGRHLHLLAVRDADLLREILADLDELLRLDDRVQPRMLRPVMEVLGQAIGRRDMRELVDLAERRAIVREHAGGRVVQRARVARMQRVRGERRLERLVVLGERAFVHPGAREKACDALRVHDERAHAGLGRLVELVVGNVRARPRLAVPADQLAARIERLAVHVARRAVVQDPPVRRPRPRPVQRLADARRVRVVAPRHLVARLRPRAAEDPAAARGRAVVLQLREAGELLALLHERLRRVFRIRQIRERTAVELHRELFGRRAFRVRVRPAQVDDRVGILAAVLAVHVAHAQEDPRHDLEVALRLARRLRALPVPLQHAAGVHERAALLGEARRRQPEHLGLDLRRIDIVELAVVLPELRRLGGERIHDHEPLQLRERLGRLALGRRRRERVEALADVAVHLARVHQLDRLQQVVLLVELRQVVVAPVVLGARRVAPPRLHEAHVERAVVLPVAQLVGPQRLLRALLDVGVEILLGLHRQRHVTRQQVRHQPEVGQPLDVRVPAQRVHPAARDADVAEQQLHHRARADHLRADRVVRPAERVQHRAGAAGHGRRREHLAYLQELVLRRAADLLDHLRRVARVVLLEQVVHAARVRERFVDLHEAVVAALVIPRRLVRVRVLVRVVAGIDAVVEREILANDEREIRVMLDVLVLDLVVRQQVMDHPAEERDVRAGANRRVIIGDRCGAREARIDDDEARVAMRLRFGDPLETARMGLGGIAAHHENNVRVLDVDPMVRHRATAKRRGKTCHRRAMSDTSLVVEREHPHAAHGLVRQIADLVAARRGGQHARREPAVDLHAVVRRLDEVRVAVRLHQLRDPLERVAPRDRLPLVGAGRAVFGLREAARAMDEVDEARALRAQRAAVDRVIGVALDVDDARRGVLRAVAEAVHQDPAADRAVRAGVAGFDSARQLVLADLGERFGRREAHQG